MQVHDPYRFLDEVAELLRQDADDRPAVG